MDSVKGRRLAALEQRNPGIAEAATWVAQNQSMFRGRLYGPVIGEVEVSNEQHAAMLEQHVQSECCFAPGPPDCHSCFAHAVVCLANVQQICTKPLLGG